MKLPKPKFWASTPTPTPKPSLSNLLPIPYLFTEAHENSRLLLLRCEQLQSEHQASLSQTPKS